MSTIALSITFPLPPPSCWQCLQCPPPPHSSSKVRSYIASKGALHFIRRALHCPTLTLNATLAPTRTHTHCHSLLLSLARSLKYLAPSSTTTSTSFPIAGSKRGVGHRLAQRVVSVSTRSSTSATDREGVTPDERERNSTPRPHPHHTHTTPTQTRLHPHHTTSTPTPTPAPTRLHTRTRTRTRTRTHPHPRLRPRPCPHPPHPPTQTRT